VTTTIMTIDSLGRIKSQAFNYIHACILRGPPIHQAGSPAVLWPSCAAAGVAECQVTGQVASSLRFSPFVPGGR
jgi:hypothetical protein